MAKPKKTSGWFKQRVRHSNARKYGKAGGRYKTIHSYRDSPKGLISTRRIILNRKLYVFKDEKGAEHHIYSPSYKEAKQIFELGKKQKRYDFGNVVVFARTEKEAKRKLLIERKRRKLKDSDGDGVPDKQDCEPLNPKKQGKKHQNILTYTPYASEVLFYANPTNRKTIIIQKKYVGKGWYDVRVGGDTFKTRRPEQLISENLSKNYSRYKKVSFFWTTSYHAGKTGFGNYGTEDYTIDYTKRTKTGKTFFLQQPIKTETKTRFGKEINKINETITDYIALNWRPENKTTKLFIEHTRYNPFGKKEIYKSKEYLLKEKKKAIQDFKKYVSKIA